MNNPAAKEPSMDEILSSIRQIIADEDSPAKSEQQAETATDENVAPAEPVAAESEADAAMLAAVAAPEPEPLALSPDQMIGEPDSQKDDLDGISFDPEVQQQPLAANSAPKPQPIPEPQPAPVAEDEPEPAPEPEPVIEEAEEIELVVADDVAFDETAPQPLPPSASSPQDMSEKLLAPSTDAAARHAFARLGALSIGGAELTLEDIVRDMLRPMLKEWLDQNLPATVERMVEKEIERVSRGS